MSSIIHYTRRDCAQAIAPIRSCLRVDTRRSQVGEPHHRPPAQTSSLRCEYAQEGKSPQASCETTSSDALHNSSFHCSTSEAAPRICQTHRWREATAPEGPNQSTRPIRANRGKWKHANWNQLTFHIDVLNVFLRSWGLAAQQGKHFRSERKQSYFRSLKTILYGL